MRPSVLIGTAIYVASMGVVIGGAYAAFEAIVGTPSAQNASFGVAKQGPGVPSSRKWTPVEIKREVAQLPSLPPYVARSSTAQARAARNVQKRAVAVAQRSAPAYAQRTLAYATAPVQTAYAPVEEARSVGPFGFKF